MMINFIKKLNYVLLVTVVFIFPGLTDLSAEDNVITVYFNEETAEVNKKIFGSSLLSIDTEKKEWPSYYYNRANYGTGIWDPDRNESVKTVVDLARNAGISVMRFSIGNWKDAIGDKRKRYFYGIDEFMETVREIGAEPDFLLSYHFGDEQDASDLVEYLNAPAESKYPWAEIRASNGHPEPYGVKYFEFGNEVFVHDRDAEKYAAKYLIYQKKMREVDPSVQLGLVLHHYDWRWDRKVLERTGNYVDFVVRHIYPPKDLAYYQSEEHYDINELYKMILGSIDFYTDKQFVNMQKVIKELTGRNDVYQAITEYNVGVHEKGLRFRFSLGAALVNAELLRVFMKPGNKILMANNFHFVNDYLGMIKSEEDYTKHIIQDVPYMKRPTYYVYELYYKHFGDILIKTDVKSGAFDIGQYKPYMKAYINNISNRILVEYEWLNNKWIYRLNRSIMSALYSREGEVFNENLLTNKWETRAIPGIDVYVNDQVLRINFKNPREYNYYHSVKYAAVEPNTYYKLSGYIKTDKLIDKNGVSLEVQDGKSWTETNSAARTPEIKGSVDWEYVATVYKTLPDAKTVKIMARRGGLSGPLTGNAYFKDVKLQKYIPPDTFVPYLTVNASKSSNNDQIYLIVMNKNMNEPMTTVIDIKGFNQQGNETHEGGEGIKKMFQINAWVLNGPAVDATNEENPDNVRITHSQLDIRDIPFKFTFEPHSLTAIEVKRK